VKGVIADTMWVPRRTFVTESAHTSSCERTRDCLEPILEW
jgi:hypothetical protein